MLRFLARGSLREPFLVLEVQDWEMERRHYIGMLAYQLGTGRELSGVTQQERADAISMLSDIGIRLPFETRARRIARERLAAVSKPVLSKEQTESFAKVTRAAISAELATGCPAELIVAMYAEDGIAIELNANDTTLLECFTGHARALQMGTYSSAWKIYQEKHDLEAYASEVCGYYTADPKFRDRILTVAKSQSIQKALEAMRAEVKP